MPIESTLDTHNYNFSHGIVRDLAWSKTEINIYKHQKIGEKKPLQLLRYNNQKEAERLILVPDEWLAKIKLDSSKQAKISQV
ncbi:Cobyric acid synthase [Moritella viscosa]|uniref:hypothetical protein n=1 Tax=Moritella viscosa TaxID=80854 RepID=UPI000915B66C|nr:hypothetical protein [Moritella viscosa]SGZ05467.1 Cobyric acid synthase [Moritella viscosa]